jgi:acyl-CoA synthetase (AMP-forming)/AMP-acid ligase II
LIPFLHDWLAMASAELPAIPFLICARAAAEKNPDKPAIVDGRTRKEHTYADLLRDATTFREQLFSNLAPGTTDLAEARVAALVPNGCKAHKTGRMVQRCGARMSKADGKMTVHQCIASDSWVVAQWATWVSSEAQPAYLVRCASAERGSTAQAAGGFYVPILHTHPVAEMRYIVENSEAQTLVVHKSLEDKGRELAEKAGWVQSSMT